MKEILQCSVFMLLLRRKAQRTAPENTITQPSAAALGSAKALAAGIGENLSITFTKVHS